MRRIKFTTYKSELVEVTPPYDIKYIQRINKPTDHVGIFHEWGLDTEESDNGFASFTVAICEEDDTKLIFLVHPNLLTFLE